MELLTKQLEKIFEQYPIGSQDGKGDDAKILCKYFLPCGGATWFVLEAEKVGNDYRLFTYATIYGDDYEYGYVMLSDIKSVSDPMFHMPAERDVIYDDGNMTLAQGKKQMGVL